MAHRDQQLADSLLSGDEASYRQFFDDTYPRLHRFCGRRVPVDDVDDIAMNTMTQVFRRLETYRGEASLFTWVCQVARSEVSNYYRKRDRSPQLVSLNAEASVEERVHSIPDEVTPEPQAHAAASESTHQLSRALDELPGSYGRLLEAKYVEGRSMREIAQELGMTTKAVESALTRARRALKEKLQSRPQTGGASIVPLWPLGTAPEQETQA